MSSIIISRFSSLNFDEAWIKPFEVQEMYWQYFATKDVISGQYSIPQSYNRPDLWVEDLDTGGHTSVLQELISNFTDEKGDVRDVYYYRITDFQTGSYRLNIELDGVVLKSAFFCVLELSELQDTLLLEYTNRRNEFDVVFSQEDDSLLRFAFRVKGGFLPSETSFMIESNDFRNQTYALSQLSALPYRREVLTLGDALGVPTWVGEKINLIFSTDSVLIDGVKYTRSEKATPEITIIGYLYPRYIYKMEVEREDAYNTDVELPNISYSISVDPQSIELTDEVLSVNVQVASSHAWEVVDPTDDYTISQVNGSSGTTTLTIGTKNTGNDRDITFRITGRQETAVLKVTDNALPAFERSEVGSVYTEFAPNPNNGGNYNTWVIYAYDWDNGDGSDDGGGWSAGNDLNNPPVKNMQTLQTIRIGEHEFTRENFKFRYFRDHQQWDITQEQIDNAQATVPSIKIGENVGESRHYNGGYAVLDSAIQDAITFSQFYDSRASMNSVSRFDFPASADFAQVLSMADDTSIGGLYDFFVVRPSKTDASGTITEMGGDSDLAYPFDHLLVGANDRSGLHIVPTGRRYNGTEGGNTIGEFYNYRSAISFRVNDGDDLPYSTINIYPLNGTQVRRETGNESGASTYHLTPVRLCRRLTPEELGYELYADEVNDKIIITAWNDAPPQSGGATLTPISKGRLRGLAVRRINKEKTKVVGSLSELRGLMAKTDDGGANGWDGFNGL